MWLPRPATQADVDKLNSMRDLVSQFPPAGLRLVLSDTPPYSLVTLLALLFPLPSVICSRLIVRETGVDSKEIVCQNSWPTGRYAGVATCSLDRGQLLCGAGDTAAHAHPGAAPAQPAHPAAHHPQVRHPQSDKILSCRSPQGSAHSRNICFDWPRYVHLPGISLLGWFIAH